MNLNTTARLIDAEKQLLVKVEEWAKATNDKMLRRRLCRLMHKIEQDLAKMQESFDREIEERR
jgi:replicative DNA helicase